MMMRCRLFVMGATAVFSLAMLADAARAGSGHVPAPQAISGPIASAQHPSPQGDWGCGECVPCGPVVYECCEPKHHPFSGLKCKLGGIGNGLKCGVRDGLHGMKGRLGGFKLCHKKAACEPVCYEAPCAPCGDVYPSGQGVVASGQGYYGGTPQAPGK